MTGWVYVQHQYFVNFTENRQRQPVYINMIKDPVEHLISSHIQLQLQSDGYPAAPRPEEHDQGWRSCPSHWSSAWWRVSTTATSQCWGSDWEMSMNCTSSPNRNYGDNTNIWPGDINNKVPLFLSVITWYKYLYWTTYYYYIITLGWVSLTVTDGMFSLGICKLDSISNV